MAPKADKIVFPFTTDEQYTEMERNVAKLQWQLAKGGKESGLAYHLAAEHWAQVVSRAVGRTVTKEELMAEMGRRRGQLGRQASRQKSGDSVTGGGGTKVILSPRPLDSLTGIGRKALEELRLRNQFEHPVVIADTAERMRTIQSCLFGVAYKLPGYGETWLVKTRVKKDGLYIWMTKPADEPPKPEPQTFAEASVGATIAPADTEPEQYAQPDHGLSVVQELLRRPEVPLNLVASIVEKLGLLPDVLHLLRSKTVAE